MARVTGIGGVFVRARDPEALGAWYKRHLGVAYADGFAKLVASLEGCADDEALVTANVHWLRRIGEMADSAAIRTGVHAYLSAQPLAERISVQDRREDPAPAWYDAGRLLALSGAP